MMRLLIGSAVCLLGPGAAAASPWQSKAVGVILISESGGGDWDRFVSHARKSLGKGIPIQTYVGSLATRELQHAVDRLHAEKVRRIVVVPVVLESDTPESEQIRYLFGAEQFPSQAFLKKWRIGSNVVKRVKTRVPVVITDGLDGNDAPGRILLKHALEMSRDPKNESVILIGAGAGDDAKNERLAARLDSLAGNVAVRGGFGAARGLLVRPNTEKKPRQYEDSLRAVRDAIREKSKRAKVIAVPYLLIDDGLPREWRKGLDNLFFRWKGKTLITDDAMHAWLKGRVDAAREAEDMVRFKDDGKALPSAKSRSRINP